MNRGFIILLMIFLHIVDDFYLQGWLASAKQKEFWEKNAPQRMYKYDYIWALIMHSFSWTFMIMLPIAYIYSFVPDKLFFTIFLQNWMLHAVVDDLKANRKVINLLADQSIHIFQIISTAVILLA